MIGLAAVMHASAPCGRGEEGLISDYKKWVTDVALSADGSKLAAVGGQSLLYRPGDVMVWELRSGRNIASLGGHECTVWAVAMAPDGMTLATGGYDGSLKLWNVATGEAREPAARPGHWVRCLSFSPDGSSLAVGNEEGKLSVYDVGSLELRHSVEAHAGAIYDLAYSASGTMLATVGTDSLAKLWSADRYEVQAVLGRKPEPSAPADGEKVEGRDDKSAKEPEERNPAAAAEQQIASARSSKGRTADEPAHETPPDEAPPQPIWTVAWSPDGLLVATGGADRKVRLWNASGEAKAEMTGHRDWVTCLAFSPDGSEIASAGYDGQVILWDVARGETASKFQPQRGSLWAVAYSGDGRFLVAAGKLGIVVWERGWQERQFTVADGSAAGTGTAADGHTAARAAPPGSR